MVLGVLSYAGEARRGMDASAQQRRQAEEEQIRLEQSRRAESEAQRQAQMQAFARQQQLGVMRGEDLGEGPTYDVPSIASPVQTPAAGVQTPAAGTTPTGTSRAGLDVTQQAPVQAPLDTKQKALDDATKALERLQKRSEGTGRVGGRNRPSQPELAAAQTAVDTARRDVYAQYPTLDTKQLDDATKALERLQKRSEGAGRGGVRSRPSQQELAAAQTAVDTARRDVDAQIQRVAGLRPRDEQQAAPAPAPTQAAPAVTSLPPEVQQPVQQAVTQVRQTQQAEQSPVAYAAISPDFVPQIPAMAESALSQRQSLVTLYNQAVQAGYPELAASYRSQVSDIDNIVVSMYQAQALDVLRKSGRPEALAAELQRNTGIPTTITTTTDGRFVLNYGGAKRTITRDQLAQEAQMQLDADYRAKQADRAAEVGLLELKSLLNINEEQAKAAFTAMKEGHIEQLKAQFKVLEPTVFSLGTDAEGINRGQGLFLRDGQNAVIVGFDSSSVKGLDGKLRQVNAPFVQPVRAQ